MKKNMGQLEYRALFTKVLICAVFIVPFIVRLHIMNISGRSAEIFSSNGGKTQDWFLYCKELAVMFIAVGCISAFIGGRIFPDEPYRKSPVLSRKVLFPAGCMGVYLLFAVVSAIFSREREVTLWGSVTEYEGIIALSAYAVLFLSGYNYINEDKQERFYRQAFFVLISVISVLAAFEYFYKPLLELPFMKYIIAPSEYREAAESLKIRNTFRESVLMFYNSNYLGGFCTIIFPVSLYYVAAAKDLKMLGASVVSVMCLFAVLSSNSTAAFYTAVIEAAFVIVFLAVKKKFEVRKAASYVCIILAGIIIAGAASDVNIVSTIRDKASNSGAFTGKETAFVPDSISFEDYSIRIKGEGAEYLIHLPVATGEKLNVTNEGRTDVDVVTNDYNSVSVRDNTNGKKIDLYLLEGILHMNLGYKESIDFAVTTKGLRMVVQNAALLSEVPSAHFNGTSYEKYYNSFTGRGYIWLNSLPILKKTMIIGRGAGNFPFEFVQNDVCGLYRTHGTAQIITDKPHNWYLQIAITCGIPALIAVLALFISFIFKGGKTLFTAKDTDMFGLCLYTGLCGFMLMGMVNDSIITVNPFFWFNFGAAYYRLVLKKGDSE